MPTTQYYFEGMIASTSVQEYVERVGPAITSLPPDEFAVEIQNFHVALAALDAMIDADMPKCNHCGRKPAVLKDYRGLDVISKYDLCEDCAGMTDEEFFDVTLTCNACRQHQPEEARHLGPEQELFYVCGDCNKLSDEELIAKITQKPIGD